MLDMHLTDGREPVSILPESLRRAVLDSVHERADAPRPVAGAASFRERLDARRAVRPQSTLAIVSGVQHPTLARDRVERRAPARPVRPKRAIGAGVEPLAERTPLMARAMSSMSGALPAITLSNGLTLGGGDGDDAGGMSARLSKLSQLAFAGLAVLGFAGLSFMAADNALTDLGSGEDGESDADAAETRAALQAAASQRITSSQASALAMAGASEPMDAAPQPWFDYKAIAFDIAARNAQHAEAQRLANAEASAAAARRAATAIAEAEAQQLAEAQRLARLAEATRLADMEAEKRRLAEEEAARVARMEAIRQAELQAEREAAAEAEATRLAELEARRLAQAEAEAMRLARIEAERLADARRIAAAEVQALRGNVTYVSMADAVSLSAEPVAAPVVKPLVAQAPVSRPVATWTAYTGPMPVTASLKPARPLVLVAQAPVQRTAPTALKPNTAHVRAFEKPAPVRQASQSVAAFMAERIQRTSDAPLPDDVLSALKGDFLAIVNTAQDGETHSLSLPGGGVVQVMVEQTSLRETRRPVLKSVNYSASAHPPVQTAAAAQLERRVTLTCRDISYVIPGKERGRFAACESGKGEWLISRASDTANSSI